MTTKVLTRSVGDRIRIETAGGDEIDVMVSHIGPGRVRLAVRADQSVRVDRGEVQEAQS